MTSNGQDIDLPRSMKNLFTLLSGSLNLKSHQFIATELERNSKQLTNGLSYYRSHNPNEDSLTELKKNKSIQSLPVEVLAKTSVFLDLSADQCKDLFHSYLMYEFKGTPETVKTLFTNDIRVKQLFSELNQYYYSERVFSLFCLKQILSHWKKDSDHVYQQIFQSFLERINGKNDLLPKLIKQLVKLNDSPVPSRMTNGPYFTDSLAKEWVHNNLKEQTEILELLLLFLKQFETSIDSIIELLNLFRSNGFGLKYTRFNRSDCDFMDENVFAFIGFLQSMIIVESLDLKWLYECQQKDIECQLIKKENAKQLKELETIIVNLSSGVVQHSPIFMSWMIVRGYELPDFDSNTSSSVVSQLGSNALQLNVFSYLQSCLNLPQTTALNGTLVSDLIYRSISDMLSITFNVYNIEMLTNSMTSLNHLCIQLFQNDYIAKDVFDNGLDTGLGLIISTGLTNFPFKVNPVLSFCESLSKTEFCKNIFERLSILSNLTSYTEPYDSSLTNYLPTEDDSFVLIRDQMLFRDTDLLIRKGTKGLHKIVNNSRVIEWIDINIDGWKLIYHRFKEQYDLISRGQLHSVPEIALLEMSQITDICSNLIKHNSCQHIPGFTHILSLCFETYELFSSLDTPYRLFMASVLELSASVISTGLSDATNIWNRLTSRRFMPYMIGLTSDLKEIISGNDTNTSVFGRLITSEECLKGRFELCLSFLTLIEKVVQKSELKENNDLMASLIFIIQEVFPSHFFWTFKEENHFHKIGRLCFGIFYTILSKTQKTSNKTIIEKIVIKSLMEGKAAQTLLKVIKSGEMNVRNVILSAGNDNSLTNDDQIIIVRQSLSTLNRLLVLDKESNSEASSVVSTALFSSQSKPNMLLIVSHYVYQRYDTHLATLAVQLFTELAKRFPMSMLACLGSEAESMREHFLNRLEEVTEDLNLKIALLNFLSACAERQPGLMEMFLNVDNEDNENTTGCLQTVLEILEEKREAKYFCPFELHLASLKFLYTFWVGPHLLAIDSLKKTRNVWTLITFPLFEESTFDVTLSAYILRILAREIFYIKTLERDKFDSDLENKFKTMRESDRLIKLSKFICFTLLSEDTITDDSRLLLSAWKDFIVSIIRFDPFDITDDMKIKLSNDIIDCLLSQLKRNRINRELITTLSDILLMILIKWKNTCIDSEEELNTKIGELLKSCEALKDVLPFSVLHSIEASVIQYLQLSTNDFNCCEWISYSCQLLNQSLRIIEKQIRSSEKNCEIEYKLSVTSMSLLQTLITRNSSRVSIWTQVLRTNFIIESVTNLLNYLNEKRTGLELAVHIMSLLVELSSIETSVETLFLIGFVENLCISLQNTYISESVSVLKTKFSSSLNWCHVFHLSIRLIVNLVKHLRHHFVDTAITFVAIHLDHMTDVLRRLRKSPKINELIESILIVTLCHSLSRYHQIWRTTHPFSFQQMQDEILKTLNSMIAFLIRPNYLSYVLENPEPTKHVVPKEITPKKISPTVAFESKSLRQSISWEQDLNIDSIKSSILDSFFTFEAFSIAFIQNVSPNVLQIMERQGLANDWNVIVNTSFSSPDVDPDLTLSFGSLINCIHMCIKTLNRSQKSSDSGNGKNVSQNNLIFIFESSLSFMVSQAMVAQMSSVVSVVDKQIIVREIKSELSTIISNVSPRQSKRLSQSSNMSTPRSPSATSSLIEGSFVKFLLQFVDKISQ